MSWCTANFTVEKVIGCGRFSEVCKAFCHTTATHVALKTVKLAHLDPVAVNDCVKEQLNHANIIEYLGSFQEDECLYIVVGLAEWGDLAGIISHFRTEMKLMSEKTVWKLFSQITAGLDHMHSKRIMHRDLKPANVLISGDGVIKIGDLGLSRLLSEMTLEVVSLLGSPNYMSPERLRNCGYSFSSDIWSLGCILFEMAALQPPFFAGENNLMLLVTKIESGIYPPVPCPRYSRDMNRLVDECLETDPSRRPQSSKVNAEAQRMLAKYRKDACCHRKKLMAAATGGHRAGGRPTLQESPARRDGRGK